MGRPGSRTHTGDISTLSKEASKSMDHFFKNKVCASKDLLPARILWESRVEQKVQAIQPLARTGIFGTYPITRKKVCAV